MIQWFSEHLLTVVLFEPLLGGFLILFLHRENKAAIRWVANITAFIGFLVSLLLVLRYQRHVGEFQFVEKYDWIPSIGARYFLGIDGISLLLIMLTTVLGFLAILSSWALIEERVKEYYFLFLLLQTGMLGVFMSLDFVLFYVFWEVMLVPMYFIIGVWGHERKLYAAIKFFIYTLIGSVLILLGILALYFNYHSKTGIYSFDYTELIKVPLPPSWEVWVFWAFFVGFAIKVPMFPFHTWLPDAHVEAPTAGSVILAGVLLKMGTYGFIRFSLPLLPMASRKYVWAMAALSIVAIIYGALVCMMQKDMKKLIAYSSVSHLGFCTLGIFALNPHGISGSVIQQVNHGISTGALFLIVGLLYERRHTREIAQFGGLSTPMPNFATLYMIMTLSSLGLPLLNGFIGEFVILQGAWQVSKTWAAWAVAGIVLGAAYLLWLYQRTMFGEVKNPANVGLRDVNLREAMTLIPLVIWAFWIGIYPKPYFQILEKPVAQVVERVNPDFYRAARPLPPAPEPAPQLPEAAPASSPEAAAPSPAETR